MALGRGTAEAQTTGGPTSEALAKLRRGEWTFEQYVEDRVERALARLPRGLSAEQREVVSATLRFQLATDPALEEILNLLKHRVQSPVAG